MTASLRGRQTGRPDERDRWWRFAHHVVGFLLRLGFRLRFVDDGFVPLRGAAVVAANHVSLVDPVILAYAVSRRRRAIRFLSAIEFFRRPFFGWALRTTRQIPISRGRADSGALQQISQAIKDGSLAGIFPEGRTRARGEGPLPGHKGVARIALAAGVPVIPVGISGPEVRWPSTGLRLGPPLRPRVAVVFGPPIPSEGDPRSRADVRSLTDRVMGAIGDLEARARAQIQGPPVS